MKEAAENKLGAPPPKSRKEKCCSALKKCFLYRWLIFAREHYPALAAGVVGVLVLSSDLTGIGYVQLLASVLPTVITVASILAGFQGTTHTVLIGFVNSRAFRQLRQAGQYDPLLTHVANSLYALLAFIGYAIVVLLFTNASPDLVPSAVWVLVDSFGDYSPWFYRINAALLASLFAYAMLASVQLIGIVVAILRLPPKLLQ